MFGNHREVLKICIHQQQELIGNYNQRISELNADTFKRNASASQSEDRRSGKVDLLIALERELSFAQKELAYLSQLDISAENKVVSHGAMVITDQINFFIGISTDRLISKGSPSLGFRTTHPSMQTWEIFTKTTSLPLMKRNITLRTSIDRYVFKPINKSFVNFQSPLILRYLIADKIYNTVCPAFFEYDIMGWT